MQSALAKTTTYCLLTIYNKPLIGNVKQLVKLLREIYQGLLASYEITNIGSESNQLGRYTTHRTYISDSLHDEDWQCGIKAKLH